MIVSTMTHEEVYRELAKEREAITTWWRHQLESERRRAIKCKKFPLEIFRDYTSTRKNRYMFYSRVFDKRMRYILTGVCVVRLAPEGLTAYTTWLGDQRLIRPMVLTPHMLRRYAERAKVQKTGSELMKHYFIHNPHGEDSHNNRVVGRSVRWNGEDHQSCCVEEGILLGQVVGDIYIVRTFITYDMCTGQQKQEFDAKRKEILSGRDMYNKIIGFYL